MQHGVCNTVCVMEMFAITGATVSESTLMQLRIQDWLKEGIKTEFSLMCLLNFPIKLASQAQNGPEKANLELQIYPGDRVSTLPPGRVTL